MRTEKSWKRQASKSSSHNPEPAATAPSFILAAEFIPQILESCQDKVCIEVIIHNTANESPNLDLVYLRIVIV